MKRPIQFLIAAVLLQGCVNVAFVRNPLSEERVTQEFQATKATSTAAFLAAFPQLMSDAPSDSGFQAYNLFTIPLGAVILVDSAFEAVLDTIFWPADAILADSRSRETCEKEGGPARSRP